MFAKEFEFNGITSSDYGYYIMNFDNSNNGFKTIETGDVITFTTSKGGNSNKWNFHGYTVDSPITTTIQIGKIDCSNLDDYEISREEFAFLRSWLERTDGYRWLRFIQDGYETTYYKAQITIKPVEMLGKKVGAELTITCDSNRGYSDVQIYEVECDDGDTFEIYNDSDDVGSIIFDVVDITNISMTSGVTKLVITNDQDNKYILNSDISYYTSIDNCVADEWIEIKNKQITSTKRTDEEICNDFNYNFMRLINYSDVTTTNSSLPYPTYNINRINTYTVTGGHCKIVLTYRTVRSVMA